MNGIALWLERQRPLGLAACCARLVIAVVLWGLPVSFFAYLQSGRGGVLASLVAGSICLVAGLMALAATAMFRGPHVALWALLFGLLFRMGLPLGIGLYLSRSQWALAEGGVFGLIVAYYLFTLIAETLLSLRLTRSLALKSPTATGGGAAGGGAKNCVS